MRGTRWRRCTGAGRLPAAVAAGVRQRAGPGGGRAVPAAGRARAGADHQPQPNWPPGQALEVPVLDTEVAASFLVTAQRRSGRAGRHRTGHRAGRAAAGAGAGRCVRPGQRWQPGRVPGVVPEAAAGDAGPGRPRGYGRTVATTWSLAFTELEQSAPQAVGLLRLLAFCAPEAIPLRLLLQPRPGLGGRAGRLRWRRCWCRCWAMSWRRRTRSRRCAGIRWSRPAGDGAVSVHRLVQAVTADQMPEDLAGVAAGGGRAWSRPPSPTIHSSRRPGRCLRCCCRTPRRPCPLTAAAWSRSRTTWGIAAATWPPGSCGRGIGEDRAQKPGPRATRAPCPPGPARLLDWAGGGCGRGPGPVRRAAARPRAGVRRRAPRHPGHPRQPRLLDRGGGGCGRGPRPVRRAAARPRAGVRAPSTPTP